MKRNLHFFAAAVATISLLASCAEEIMDDTTLDEDSNVTETVPSEGMVTLTFKADYPNPVTEETRTTIAEDGTVAWEIGDEITLYYMESGNPANALATAKTEGASADFQVTIPDGVTEVYAVYPAGAGELTAEGVLKVKTGETRNGSFEQANYAAAWAEVSDQMSISFKNVVGLFKVKLPEGGIIKDGDVSHTIKSIAIAGKKSELSFLGDVAVTEENGSLSFSDPENALAETVIELDSEVINTGYAYIPSLPVTSADGLVFRFQNTEGKYLPAAVTKDDKAITLERGHLKPVNTACESVIFDWYFAEDGQGDGKSAGSPAGVAKFQKLLNDSQYLYGERRLDGARLNLAAGKYSLTEQLNIQGTEAGDIAIVGAGMEASLIDGAALGMQMVYCTSAKNLHLNKVTFQNGTSSKKGGVMMLDEAQGKLSCVDCAFLNNYCTANSGVIYFGGLSGADFAGCLFQGNTTDKNPGGALCSAGSSQGDITFSRCTFKDNVAGKNSGDGGSNGGALYHASEGVMKINDCLFESNVALQGGAIYNQSTGTVQVDNTSFIGNSVLDNGGAIYGNSKGGVIFVSRSLFRGNKKTKSENGGAAAVYSGSPFGLYNDTFSYNHNTTKQSASVEGAQYVVANCTFVESMKSTIGVIRNRAESEHISTVVNSIVLTTSTDEEYWVALGTWQTEKFKYLDSAYNMVTGVDTRLTEAAAETTSYKSANKDTFGWGDWTEENKNTKSYPWDGNISDISGYSNCKLSDVESTIKTNISPVGTSTLGVEFWEWLTTTKTADGYSIAEVDVRGIKRNTDVMWPGSYQE